MTIDSAPGMTTDEHINAMPRGSAGANGFKSYTAESRHVRQAYTVVSEAAVFEVVKHRRALGDVTPVTTEDLWNRVGEDMSRKDYKPLGMDLAHAARRDHEKTVAACLQFEHRMDFLKEQGRHPGAEVRVRIRENAVARTLRTQIHVLDKALAQNGVAVTELAHEVESFLQTMRTWTANIAQRGVEAARDRQRREEEAARPSFSLSPY